MSSIFAPAVAAILRNDVVSWCYGVTFNFTSGPMSVWQGVGPTDATAFGGPVFQGLGNFGTIDAVEIGVASATQAIQFKLSGVDPTLFPLALNQATEVQGQRAQLYMLFFANGGPLIGCASRRVVVMDKIIVSAAMGESGPMLTMQLNGEPILAPKNGRPWALLTQADQLARYPNDNALERVTELAGAQTLLWIADP